MKVVLQDGIKDCGVCCLLSIIRYYGGEVSREYLREITNTTKDGVSFYNLIEGARKIGFEAIGVTGKIENIDINSLPCIVHFIVNKSYQHFVVLYEINKKKNQVVLMDPAKGKKTILLSEFKLLSSDNYLLLKPLKKLPIIKKKNIIYKNIKHILYTNKKVLLLIIILTMSYFIFNIILSFHFKYLLEYSINYSLSNSIYYISYILLFTYFLKNINIYFRNLLLNKWTMLFDYETTSLTYKQILLLPYLYYKNRTTGEVVSRFKDLNTIRSFVSNLFCVITTDFISIIIFFSIMINYNMKLTLFIMIPLLVIIIYSLVIQKKKKNYIKTISKKEDIINSYIIQGVSNVDTIKGSHLEKRLIDKFSLGYKSFLETVYSYSVIIENYKALKNFLNDIILIIIYGVGSFYVIKEKMMLSTLIIYQSFFSYYINSFYNLLSIVEEYNEYRVALDRVEELFVLTKDNFKNNYFYLPFSLDGDIIFKNLSYQVGNKLLFDKLNLKIKRGEKILLSGPSGCGKSTLVKMLLRYIEVNYNNITIADIDINHYHLDNIRSNITYVTSNEYLFTDSLKNNICLYKDYKLSDLEKVTQVCMLSDILKNSISGYDTLIEENGFNFSNGERQRIILARSIIKKTSIYIFDEALGQIDINREKKILTNIFDYLKDKTVIVISHRFNNKKLFDRVLKIESGKIYDN